MTVEIKSSFTPGPALITASVLSEASPSSIFPSTTRLAWSTKILIAHQMWLILADNGWLQLCEREKCLSKAIGPYDFSDLQKLLLSLWKEDVDSWLMDGYLEQVICSFLLFKIKVSVSYLISVFGTLRVYFITVGWMETKCTKWKKKELECNEKSIKVEY